MNTNTALAILFICIAAFSGFKAWSNDQVKIECYKVNIELVKQNKFVIDCDKK